MESVVVDRRETGFRTNPIRLAFRVQGSLIIGCLFSQYSLYEMRISVVFFCCVAISSCSVFRVCGIVYFGSVTSVPYCGGPLNSDGAYWVEKNSNTSSCDTGPQLTPQLSVYVECTRVHHLLSCVPFLACSSFDCSRSNLVGNTSYNPETPVYHDSALTGLAIGKHALTLQVQRQAVLQSYWAFN